MDYKTGMFIYSLAFLLGVLLVQQFSVLPDAFTLMVSLYLIISCAVVFLFYIWIKSPYFILRYTLIVKCYLLILIGILYSSFFAEQQLSHRLDEVLVGENIVISGKVSSIPVQRGSVQSFEFDIDTVSFPGAVDTTFANNEGKGTVLSKDHFPEKLKLNWYYGKPVNADETWQFLVRLKPPHGFLNPGGFDYEAWLFQHGIHAVGYVRKSNLNKKLNSLEMMSSIQGINSIRQHLSEKIDALDDEEQILKHESSLSLVKALAIGDKSSISNQQWRVLANTGTSHLMAISGLHIGLAMLFAYLIIRYALPVFVMKRFPAQHIALAGGCVVAFAYALIAGLSIPTQRAIIMLLVLAVMMLIRRNHRPVDALGLAAFLVLLFDPLAVLSVGFWFSFSAVAVIYISVKSTEKHQDLSIFKKLSLILLAWVRLQLLISLFLLPLSLFMFQQGSLVSPLANLLLIPYVSFLVVPVVLLAIISSYLAPLAADFLFVLASNLLDFIWPLLQFLSELPFALLVKGNVDIVDLLVMTAAMLVMFFSKEIETLVQSIAKRRQTGAVKKQVYFVSYCANYWLIRFAALLMCVPLLFFANQSVLQSGEFGVVILDVGQGSAAVLQTRNHVLVFDTGAKFSEKLDVGRSVIIPYLRSQSKTVIDMLVISHGDADHIGGAMALLDEFPETRVIGQDIENLKSVDKMLCVAGQHWHWDGVEFSILSPLRSTTFKNKKKHRNNHSCVLRVSSAAGSILFTGDIEKKAERYLLAAYAERLNTDILIVPHHGSNTSSGIALIDAVKPKLSVISAGYKNRYKLPSQKVVARYDALNSELMNTAMSGAIMIEMRLNGGYSVNSYRQTAKRYWHHVLD